MNTRRPVLPTVVLSRTARRAAGAVGAAVAVAAVATTLQAAPAQAQGPLDPQDIPRLLLGEVQALLSNRTDMLRCPTLAVGSIGLTENAKEAGRSGVDEGNPLKAGDPTDAPTDLPDQVLLRTSTETFNRRYQFAVRDGRIWYKSNTAVTGIVEPWARLKSDRCFDGKVVGISADDDEMIAIDRDRWIYGMDGALKAAKHFNWSLRWGPLFWTGPGRKLPSEITAWSWSVVSQLEDGTWSDDAGNAHKVGDGKVSHIWGLAEGGRRMYYLDPWLPSDLSYEMCGPHRGRFRAVNISSSGSTVFVVGRHGDLFTRLYDFDIAGADPLFFSYSYEDQRGAAKPVIQLPSPDWVQQPKIPGTITDRISIHKIGPGAIRRELRVEGRQGSTVGIWHKDIGDPQWQFTPTGGQLVGTVLDNPAHDTSAVDLADGEDRAYAGAVPGGHVSIPTYHHACSPAPVEVTLSSGTRIELVLHTTDDIRQHRRGQGLDHDPRKTNGALEVPDHVRESTDPEVQAFVARLGLKPGQRFATATLDATTSQLTFRKQGWKLKAVS